MPSLLHYFFTTFYSSGISLLWSIVSTRIFNLGNAQNLPSQPSCLVNPKHRKVCQASTDIYRQILNFGSLWRVTEQPMSNPSNPVIRVGSIFLHKCVFDMSNLHWRATHILLVIVCPKKAWATHTEEQLMSFWYLSLIHIWRCRRYSLCRSRWSPYH